LPEKLKEIFYQEPPIAKRYFRLFVDKIIINENKVTIVTRKDILWRAISLAKGDELRQILTAGVEWPPKMTPGELILTFI